jgi:hypothetical protein
LLVILLSNLVLMRSPSTLARRVVMNVRSPGTIQKYTNARETMFVKPSEQWQGDGAHQSELPLG